MPTELSSGKIAPMSTLVSFLLLAKEKTPDEEGRDIVISMLVVGLVFLAVIALGEFSKWRSHRRRGGRAG